MKNPMELHGHRDTMQCYYCQNMHTIVYEGEKIHIEGCVLFTQQYQEVYDAYIKRLIDYAKAKEDKLQLWCACCSRKFEDGQTECIVCKPNTCWSMNVNTQLFGRR